jgi:hypothetical protein
MSGRIDGLLLEQDGIIARWQVLAAGHDDNWIENRLRRREWARVHRGVYVAHTGPVTWRQQAWAALLFYWPAALCGRSAVHLTSGGASSGDRAGGPAARRGGGRRGSTRAAHPGHQRHQGD